MIKNDISFKHIISIGSFCSVAMEIERVGRRDGSYPFDWCISELGGVLQLVENHFDGFLNLSDLKQSKLDGAHYKNSYGVHFYHDFNAHEPLHKQLPDVQRKYTRRIKRFYKKIAEPTLFVRYIYDQQEADYIDNHINEILGIFKKYNDKNNIIWIANSDIYIANFKCYFVDKDLGDTVSRKFLDHNSELLKVFLSVSSKSKKPKYYIAKAKHKIKRLFIKNCKKTTDIAKYVHYNQY